MTQYDISGKSILVTGAAGGIGSATTRALVARGARVTLVDLAQDSVDEIADTLPTERVLALAADVTSTEQMTAAVDAAVERFGRLDVVFANAGIANDPPTTMAAADLDAYEKVIEVDLLGVVRTIKPALPEISRNRGYVLITASVYAFFNGVVNSAYASSKAAVEMLGRSLRAELASEGASAGVLYPGWVTTPIAESARGANKTVTQLKERVPRTPRHVHRARADRRRGRRGDRSTRTANHRAQALEPAFRDARSGQHPRRQTPRTRPGDAGTDQAHRRRGAPAPSRARNSAAIWVRRRCRLADTHHIATWGLAPERASDDRRGLPPTSHRPRASERDAFAAHGATQDATGRRLVAAECSHKLRAGHVTSLVVSGHDPAVTRIGVER